MKKPRKNESASERTCRECGCTHNRPCRAGCTWVEADLCSTCIERSFPYWIGRRYTLTELLNLLKESKKPAIVNLCLVLEEKIEYLDQQANAALGGAPVTAPHQPAPPAQFGKGVRTSDALEFCVRVEPLITEGAS